MSTLRIKAMLGRADDERGVDFAVVRGVGFERRDVDRGDAARMSALFCALNRDAARAIRSLFRAAS